MTIAIALLNWNGTHWLEQFLPKVLEYSSGCEVYVIDNASTDNSLAFLAEHFPEVKIIRNKSNQGFAEGYNQGLQFIDAEIFCLLNTDVEVTPNWLNPIRELFESSKDIAAIQPKILDFNRREQFEFAGAGGGQIDNLGYPYCRGRIFDVLETDTGQYNDTTQIFWASGCCLFIRRNDFFNVGGFDARFFAHQEEIDLCWRLINQGKTIYYTGASTVYHVGGGTLNKNNPQKTYLNFRNNLSMLLKNLPSTTLVWVLPLRLMLDGLAGLHLGWKYGLQHSLAIIKAHGAFYAQAIGTWRLRPAKPTKTYYQTRWLLLKRFL